jgi:glycosyltransferase involved in cell wall biosynthesis
VDRILVQGWRFVPHSFALVNHYQCLQLLRRPGVSLFFQDEPYFRDHWQPQRGLLEPEDEEKIARLPPPPDQPLDITYRIARTDFRPPPSGRLLVFAVCDCGIVLPGAIEGGAPISQAIAHSNAIVITPSNWAKQGFLRSGAPDQNVAIVPHGVDTAVFHPADPPMRQLIRQEMKSGDHFIFLHVGAMTHHKNVVMLLRAFAIVARRHPHARLVLKGLESIYPAKVLLEQQFKELSDADLETIEDKVNVILTTFPAKIMARLYQVADAYVSPYMTESFNLPALEAAACGLPVICTAGGPTDDFTTPEFSLRIESRQIPADSLAPGAIALLPSFDHLVSQMLRAVEDQSYVQQANESAPKFVAQNFTWSRAVDRLLEVIQNAKLP